MNRETGVYCGVVILLGTTIAALEYKGMLAHKLSLGDFLVFLFTVSIAELGKILARGSGAGRKEDPPPPVESVSTNQSEES